MAALSIPIDWPDRTLDVIWVLVRQHWPRAVAYDAHGHDGHNRTDYPLDNYGYVFYPSEIDAMRDYAHDDYYAGPIVHVRYRPDKCMMVSGPDDIVLTIASCPMWSASVIPQILSHVSRTAKISSRQAKRMYAKSRSRMITSPEISTVLRYVVFEPYESRQP